MSCWSLAISDSDIHDVVEDIESLESALLRSFSSIIVGEDGVSSSGGVGDMRCLGAILRRVAIVNLATGTCVSSRPYSCVILGLAFCHDEASPSYQC
jgi:hypothetical protein